MTHTVAGRRALRLALLVAGLFALGLLCGERAHAADGLVPTVPTSSPERLVKPGAPLPARSVAPTVTRVTDAVTHADVTDAVTHADVTDTVAQGGDAVTRVTDTVRHVLRPAADSVVRPVGDLVETVTGELVQAPPKTLPSLPSSPSRSSLPSLPELPGPPGPPVFPAAGGQVPSAGSGPHQSGAGAVTSSSHAVVRHADAGPVGPTYYGPTRLGTDTDGVAVRGEHRGVAPGPGPGPGSDRQAPPGDPTGALGAQSAVDNGTPRHGDPHAVTPSHEAPLRLVPGVPAAVTAAGTRDRYRDIPVFPG
jgi:hypothetical protein